MSLEWKDKHSKYDTFISKKTLTFDFGLLFQAMLKPHLMNFKYIDYKDFY